MEKFKKEPDKHIPAILKKEKIVLGSLYFHMKEAFQTFNLTVRVVGRKGQGRSAGSLKKGSM